MYGSKSSGDDEARGMLLWQLRVVSNWKEWNMASKAS